MSTRDVADQLFARIYADPSDVEARAVLADLLQELGDPRGVLIATQLAGRAPDLVKEIARKHAKHLLGPLAPVVIAETAIFAGGFLDACGVHCEKEETAGRLVGRREWSTVRAISLISPGRGAWHTDVVPLLASPAMTSLREVDFLHGDDVARIGKPLPLTRLRLTTARGIETFAHLGRAFPALVELHFGAAHFARGGVVSVLQSPAVRRITRLAMVAEYGAILWLAAAQRFDAELEAATVTLDRPRAGQGWRWTLARGDDGGLTHLEGDLQTPPPTTWYQPLAEAVEIVQTVGPRLRALRVAIAGAISRDDADRAFAAMRASAPNAASTFELVP
jgi:uncharacterized protein (TIGR02996 family)